MSSSGGARKSKSSRKKSTTRRVYPKYDRNYVGPETVYATMSPSTLAMSVTKPLSVSKKTAPVPEMIEFMDIRSSTQPRSYVSVDEPLFQPLESSVVFDDYEPFCTYTKTIYFRNNDNVARRMKILPSDSPFFSVSAPKFTQKGARKDGSVAAGMELCFDVTFKPQEKRQYTYRLICVTEREKFIVPVMAMGVVACLDFQDQYSFGDVPCKSTSKQTHTIRNSGTAPAQFSLLTSGPFKATAKDSFVPVGGSTAVTLEFCPGESRDYSGELIVTYGADDSEEKVSAGGAGDLASLGRTVHIDLTGSGADVEVGMEVSSLVMDSTYISLSSSKTVKLFNRSGIPVKYSWRAFATEEEERAERQRLLLELGRMEEIEREDILAADFGPDDSDLSSDEDADESTGADGAKKAAALSALTRKYKNLRKAVHDDPFHFIADENFKVDPVHGELWPNSELEVVVTFLPSIASEYLSEIFLDITGQEQRATLDLRGIGIGPKAMFSYDVLDIGDVFLGSKHNYKLSLQNKGDIPAHYQLQPRDHSLHQGPSFKFSPENGTLGVGETHVIEVDFVSEVLGEFSQQFTFTMRGSSESLSVHFKGHVVGPTFHFDTEELNFGRVSYEFLHSKNLCLYNTSEIPMEFKLRVPQDGKLQNKEFEIIPANGSVLPGGKQSIQIDFVSTTAKVYEYFLTVDVKGVGDGLCSIPILAECGVPNVKLLTPTLEYENCFLRYGYNKDIVLKNESADLRARFEVLAQDKHSKALAEYTPAAQRGVIEPGAEIPIDLKLVCNRLGNVKLPVYIRISGSEKPPLLPVLTAVAVGPVISADLDIMDWKKIQCLQTKVQTLRLTNDSLIPAPYKAIIKNVRSKFTVGAPEEEPPTDAFGDDDHLPALGAVKQEPQSTPGEGILAPGDTVELEIGCNLDDTTLHKDTLTILVTEGESLTIGLVARGIGTTMHCDEDLSLIDFGFQFTNGTCSRKFLLENKGRRSQSLNWINTTIKDAMIQRRKEEHQEKLKQAADEKAGKKRRKKKAVRKPIKATFTVTPESIELKPRTACYFEFTGHMATPSVPEEILVCESRVGNEQKSHPVFQTIAKGTFIDPLLEPSTRSMSFEYTYEPDVPLSFHRQPLTLKNIAELPLEFTLKTQVPFNVDSYEFSLQPGESASLNVEFDPGYNDDRTSCDVEGQIVIVYAGHPQRDTVDLSGTVHFPNLSFDFKEVDFGCVLNDTATSSVVRITNTSTIDVDFQWTFIEDEDEQRAVATAKKPFIPVNQAFDILPIRGLLKPGEFEDIEVGYYGHANRSFAGLAVCEVEGGPEYEVTLKGEASDIQYTVDATELDFGNVIHSKFDERDFNIINLGKVPFSFRFSLDHITGPHKIIVSPMHGRVFEKDKQRIVVRFSPQVPKDVIDRVTVEIAHFEALDIPIIGSGIFAQASFSLPLVEPEVWPRLMDEASAALAVKSQKSANASAPSTASPPGSPSRKKRRKKKGKSPEEQLLLDTELEARRRYFLEYLMGIIEHEGSLDGLFRPSTSATKASTKSGGADAVDAPEFIVSEHLADFGNVIASTSKKKTFRVTNLGSIPVSFSLDKRLPAAHGFTVEPEKVNRLPEGTSVDFTVKFKAKKSPLGVVSVDVPIDVKGGPPVMLCLRANVTVPDIVLAPEKVDFGDVVVGQCKIVTIQVSNPSPVTSEWAIKHMALTGAMARSAARFAYEPNAGVLRPGERQNVQVTFTPTIAQNSAYTVPFRVTKNPAQKFLEVAGTGKLLALSFDPPHIALPTVRPYDPPVRQTVELVNNCEYSVEVFSLDFDKRYLDEEEIVQDVEFDQTGQMLVPPRRPGEGLQAALLPHGQAQQVRAAKAHLPFVRKHASDVLVVGPALSGKSTQALRLSEKYNLPILSIADVAATAKRALAAVTAARAEVEAQDEVQQPTEEEQAAIDEAQLPASEQLARNLWRWLRQTTTESQWGVIIDGLDVPDMDSKDVATAVAAVLKQSEASRFQLLQLQFEDAEPEPEDEEAAAARKAAEEAEAAAAAATSSKKGKKGKKAASSKGKEPEPDPGLDFIGVKVHSRNIAASVAQRRSLLEAESVALKQSVEELSPELEDLQSQVAVLDSAAKVADEAALDGQEELDDDVETKEAEAEEDTAVVEQRKKDAAVRSRCNEVKSQVDDATSRLENIARELEEHAALLARRNEVLTLEAVAEHDQILKAITLPALVDLLQENTDADETPEDDVPAIDGNGDDATEASDDDQTTGQVDEAPVEVDPQVTIDAAAALAESSSRAVVVNAAQQVDLVFASIGVEFEGILDVPQLRSELDVLPDPQTFSIVRRGTARLPPSPLRNFSIELPQAEDLRTDEEKEADAAAEEAAKSGKGTKNKDSEPEPEPVPPPTRWILEPHGSATFDVVFASDRVGKFDTTLGFEIVGDSRQFSLTGRGTCGVPTINVDARNVFMSRVKGGRPENIAMKYVTSRERFEFGPLLVGKAQENGAETVFRLSNNSDFPVNATLSIFDESDSAAAGGKGGKGKADSATPPFSIEPEALSIAQGETQEVIVRAFPSEPREYNNKIICCIKDNPDPVFFNVNCIGSAPVLEMRGPWNEPVATHSAEGGAEPEATQIALPNGVDGILDFERLLLNRMEEQTFSLQNTSDIPVCWRINQDAIADIPELTVFPDGGVLEPGATVYATVTFRTSDEERDQVTPTLLVEFADNEVPRDSADGAAAMAGGGSDIQVLKLEVRAEAYKIDSSLELKDQDGNPADKLVFGPARANEAVEHTVVLSNNGKYAVNYGISFKRPATAEVFTIEPSSGVMEAGSTAEVSLTFEAPTETHMKNNKDIQVKIIEVVTGNVESEFDITVDADAEFSKFRLQPNRGLNFGALRFGSDRTRNFELRNDGIFPFMYKLVALDPGVTDVAAAVSEAEPEKTLTKGPFEITPASGEILPNARQTISAKFVAQDAQLCKSLFMLDVSNQDMRIDQRAMMYELVGESCIPGINADDFLSIFEEQDVVHKHDPQNYTQRAFSTDEKSFTFGAVVPTTFPDGLRERFKITNISKVRATVRCAVDTGDDADAEGVFTVQPATTDLPPHEHRYISVYFKPRQMKAYSAIFKATVDDGEDPATNKLSFEVRGDGAMPSISVTNPTQRDGDSGNVQMAFPRTHLGKTSRLPLTLQNDGIVPCTVTFSMNEHSDFHLSARETSVSLAPGDSHSIEAVFKPTGIEPDEEGIPRDECEVNHTFEINVLNNRFEKEVVKLSAVAFQDRITFEDLPDEDAQDELAFADIDISAEEEGQQVSFGIRNHSDAVIRFEWPTDNENFSFSPGLGHIPVGSTKEITATFASNGVAANYDKVQIDLSYLLIQLADGATSDGWDDTQKSVRYEEEGENTAITEVIPEPAYQPHVDEVTQEKATQRTSSLFCTAHADRATYECDCPSVLSVRDTLMFQQRSFQFTVNNTCGTALAFDWGEPTNSGTQTDLVEVPCPFAITPVRGKIPANETQQFVLTFSPLDAGVFAYRADCAINNLAEDMKPLSVQMSGRGVRPVCHFDIKPSNYLVRRPAGLPGPSGSLGPLDPSIRVVEVSSLGIKVKNRCRFVAINPMSSSYEFTWEQIGAPNPVFRCTTTRGIIPPGKRFEMGFEFTPVELTSHPQESFWRFSIPQRNVSAVFLLAGEVVEPRVTFATSHLNFRQLLLGSVATEVIKLTNHEHLPFQYAFQPPAVDSNGKPPITVEPLRGVVSANSSMDVKVVFRPTAEKEYNANLLCDVRGKPGPLALNVKGEGYAVHETVSLLEGVAGESGDIRTLTPGSSACAVDFGMVLVNGSLTKTVMLSNTGKTHYEFLFSDLQNPFVTVTPSQGTVRRGNKVEVEVKFQPTRECKLSSIPLSVTIARARQYKMRLSGRGAKAALQFSFREFTFPPCFVGVADGERHSKQTVLTITNNEPVDDVSLDCLFDRTPVLDVACDPTVLRPSQSIDVPIVFTPRNVQDYSLGVAFEVNGLYKVPVLLHGEGIGLRVELAEPVMRDQDFGSIKPNQEVVKRVRLVNRSKQTATFELLEEEVAGEGQLKCRSISFWPVGPQSLRPRGSTEVELKFSPTFRVPTFRESLLIKAEGSAPVNLITVTGACVGIDVHMDTDCIPFGKVGERSKVVRKLRMENAGDVGARYRWNAEMFGPHFGVSPEEGYIGPHSDMSFNVAFQPKYVDDDIRSEGLLCQVEGMDPLPLTLTGVCVEAPEAEELQFRARVRESTTLEVELKNPSKVAWHVRPSFENPFFAGPDIVEIPAGGSASYPVTYTPLAMTGRTRTEHDPEPEGGADSNGADEVHDLQEGSLFFALPDGTSKQWRLFGRADAPNALSLPDNIVLSAPAKTQHAVQLPIRNWLSEQQRFDVVVDVEASGDNGQRSVFVTAARNVAIPPLGSRNFKLLFFAYTAGVTAATVKFINPESGEYFFYELQFEATPPGVWETLKMETICRQPVRRGVMIENPAPEHGPIQLPAPASSDDWWSSDSEELRVRFVEDLSGPSESAFEIEYRPVCANGESGGAKGDDESQNRATVEIDCGPVLGKYKYVIDLRATEGGLERTLFFKAPLGGTQTKAFRFNSFRRGSAPTFSASVGKPLFFGLGAASVAVPAATTWEGSEAMVNVIFEPEQVGSVSDVLTLTSPDGGTFRCALVGECTAPTPQGPFIVKKGGGAIQIPFKNVFNEKQSFDFSVDKPELFSVAPQKGDLDAKASTTINITFDGDEASSGRLLVTPQGGANAWIFYLSGETN